jgi:hypothetical protein
MATITVTAPHVTLMQRTDVVATHVLIVARGLPTGRAFIVPASKTIRQYDEGKAPLADTLGLVGMVIGGKVPPVETAPAGQRTLDYMLSPLGNRDRRPTASHLLYASLLHYVERSGREPGARALGDLAGLGQGVPCDLLCLRPRPISDWFTSRHTRLSQLVSERLLTQYVQIHCLVCSVKP